MWTFFSFLCVLFVGLVLVSYLIKDSQNNFTYAKEIALSVKSYFKEFKEDLKEQKREHNEDTVVTPTESEKKDG